MAGIPANNYRPTLPSRLGPTNAQGQPKTLYEQDQDRQAGTDAASARGASTFYNGAGNGANYDMSYTDPKTGLALNYKANTVKPDFQRDMNNFGNFMGRFGNMGGSGSTTGSGSLTHGDAPRVQLNTGAIDAGDAAAFSKAKDKVGGVMSGSMKALQNQFASRGLRGSSMEGRAVGSAVENGAGQLDDVARSQAVEGSRRAVDLAKTQYGGEIDQRGQDIGAETSERNFAATQQQAKLQSVLGLWNAFSGMKY